MGTAGLLATGFVLLVAGAEMLVRGASGLAIRFGVSPLVIGLTVVAYGTSTPELAVSVISAFDGKPEIALGNVVGSNIFNVLFILGISALVIPLEVAQRLVRIDVPLMIGASILLLVLSLDGELGALDGLLLVSGVVVYTVFAIRESGSEPEAVRTEYDQALGKPAGRNRVAVRVASVLAGLALLGLGAQWLVEGAVALATALGVSETMIGLTIVAAGTSLPELATSVVAAVRGERDIAVGNVVGSNLYNILAIVGIAALAAPGGMSVPDPILRFDLPVMCAVALACLPIFFTGHRIARWEGGLFVAYYVAYVLWLALESARHQALPALSAAMLQFVLPLTIVTLVVLFVRALRNGSAEARER